MTIDLLMQSAAGCRRKLDGGSVNGTAARKRTKVSVIRTSTYSRYISPHYSRQAVTASLDDDLS